MLMLRWKPLNWSLMKTNSCTLDGTLSPFCRKESLIIMMATAIIIHGPAFLAIRPGGNLPLFYLFFIIIFFYRYVDNNILYIIIVLRIFTLIFEYNFTQNSSDSLVILNLT